MPVFSLGFRCTLGSGRASSSPIEYNNLVDPQAPPFKQQHRTNHGSLLVNLKKLNCIITLSMLGIHSIRLCSSLVPLGPLDVNDLYLYIYIHSHHYSHSRRTPCIEMRTHLFIKASFTPPLAHSPIPLLLSTASNGQRYGFVNVPRRPTRPSDPHSRGRSSRQVSLLNPKFHAILQ